MIRLNSPWSGENGDLVRNGVWCGFTKTIAVQGAGTSKSGMWGWRMQAVLSFASQLRQTHPFVFYEGTQTIIPEAQTSPWKHPPKPMELRSGIHCVLLLAQEGAADPKPPCAANDKSWNGLGLEIIQF